MILHSILISFVTIITVIALSSIFAMFLLFSFSIFTHSVLSILTLSLNIFSSERNPNQPLLLTLTFILFQSQVLTQQSNYLSQIPIDHNVSIPLILRFVLHSNNNLNLIPLNKQVKQIFDFQNQS